MWGGDTVYSRPDTLTDRARIWARDAAWRAATGVGRWAARTAWRMVRRAFRRYKALGPLFLGVAVWVAAALAHLAAGGWITIGYGVLFTTPAMWWYLGLPLGTGTRRRGLAPAAQRAWYAAAFLTYAGWTLAAARFGPMPGTNAYPGILGAIMLVFQTVWSWHRRVRHEDVREIELSEVEAMWQRIPGAEGTSLYEIKEHADPRRVEARVDLIESDLTVDNLAKFRPHVAKHSGVPLTNVMLGYLPSRLEHTASLKVVYDNPCDQPVIYDEKWIPTGEEIAAGIVPFFLYPDGQRGYLRLWYPDQKGGVMALFTGDIGSGKSAGMGTALTQATMTGRVWPMAACPQDGASFPAWAGADGQAAWKAAGHGDDLRVILDQLEFLDELMADRTARLARFRWTDKWGDPQVGLPCWDYDIIARFAADNDTTPWPLVVIAIDELWRIMAMPEYAEIVKGLLKLGRKAGIVLMGATQYPGLEEFDNDQAMRQPLAAGNIFCYRNKDGVTSAMILSPELPAPHLIPAETPDGTDTKGTMIAESKGPRSAQPNYSRTVWVERAAHWAKRAAARIHPLEVEAVAILRGYLQEGRNWAAPREKVIEVAVDGEAAQVVTGGGAPAGRRVTNLDRVVEFLAGYQHDIATTGTIAAGLNLPDARVSEALGRAAKAGDPRVVDHGHGRWGLSDAARPRRELAGVAA